MAPTTHAIAAHSQTGRAAFGGRTLLEGVVAPNCSISSSVLILQAILSLLGRGMTLESASPDARRDNTKQKTQPEWLGSMGALQPGLAVRIQFAYLVSLWPFLALDDLKLDIVAFLQGLVALCRDGTVVNKNVGSIVTSNESEAFSVVEPFDFTFQRQCCFLRA